ncbi:MAG TPA: hypothetical protein VD866_11325 [Urbifossiella sp.]|nr:hypothetical protein [Urbifossiella sp.]
MTSPRGRTPTLVVLGCLTLFGVVVAAGLVTAVLVLTDHVGNAPAPDGGDEPLPAAPPAAPPADVPPAVETAPPPRAIEHLPPVPESVDIPPSAIDRPTEVPLPGVIDRVVVGGAGRFLVLNIPADRKIAVFDVVPGKVIWAVNVPGPDTLFAAGMTTLAVVPRGGGAAASFDLLTGRRTDLTFPRGELNDLKMGHSSAGPLYATSPAGLRVYDPATFREFGLPAAWWGAGLPPPTSEGGRRLTWGGGAFTAAGNGRVIGTGGANVVRLDRGRVVGPPEMPSQSWFLHRLSPDGRRIFGGELRAQTIDQHPDPTVVVSGLSRFIGDNDRLFLPAHHGPYYFLLRPEQNGPAHMPGTSWNSVTAYLYGLKQPVARVARVPGSIDYRDVNLSITPVDQHFHLIPRAKLLVAVHASHARLVLIPVDLEESAAKAAPEAVLVVSDPPRFYRPGAAFRYAVRARSAAGGIRVAVEFGPPGMTAGPDGVVSWAAPAGHAEEVSVALRLTDAAGKETYHTFELAADGARPLWAGPPRGRSDGVSPEGAFRLPRVPPPLPVTPVALAERTAYPLPGRVDRVVQAGGGRFLVLRFPTLRRLGVFDTSAARVVRYIDVAEDTPLVAAGMTKAVVYLREARLAVRYDLQTGAREAVRPLPVEPVHEVAMGAGSAGPLVVSDGHGSRLFDLDTFAEIPLPPGKWERLWPQRPPGPPRLPPGTLLGVSAAGRVIAGADGLVSLDDDPPAPLPLPFHTSMGFVRPSPDGRYVFPGGNGGLPIDRRADALVFGAERSFAGHTFLPAAHGPFYFHTRLAGDVQTRTPKLHRDARGVTVYAYGSDTPLARVRDLTDVGAWGDPALSVADQVHVIPRAKLLVTLPPGGAALTLVPLDLDKALDESGIEYLYAEDGSHGVFRPGAVARHPVRVRSKRGGVRFEVAAGPPGVAVGPDGVVTWPVPADFDRSQVRVTLRLTDAADTSARHTVVLDRADPE